MGLAGRGDNVGNNYIFLEKNLKSYTLDAEMQVKGCDRVIENEV